MLTAAEEPDVRTEKWVWWPQKEKLEGSGQRTEILSFDVSVNRRGNGDKLYNQLFHDYCCMQNSIQIATQENRMVVEMKCANPEEVFSIKLGNVILERVYQQQKESSRQTKTGYARKRGIKSDIEGTNKRGKKLIWINFFSSLLRYN